MARGDRLQRIGELQVAGELVAGKFRVSRAPIIGRQRPRALDAEPAAEEPGLHRAVDDHARPVRCAPWDLASTCLAADQRERRLQGVHVTDPLGRFELGHPMIGEPGGADLPLALQVEERAPVLGDGGAIRRWPMELEEIEPLDAEPAQRGLRLAPEAVGARDAAEVGIVPLAFPDQAALGEDVRPAACGDVGECAADHLLGVAEAIGGGGVDPVDADVERAADGGDRIGVVLRAPAGGPFGAADRPRAEAEAGDGHVGKAERHGREFRRGLRHSGPVDGPRLGRRRITRQPDPTLSAALV